MQKNARVALKISIVVPAFNEERLLGGTLEQIRRAAGVFAVRQWETELIVCDNNSTDGTAAVARACGARVVFEPVNQIGRARNCGAAAATGQWLVFVDADSHPSAALFEAMAGEIASGCCVAGGSTVKLEGNHRVAGLVTGLWNGLSRWKKWVAGSLLFCEASAFRELGGFSNELFATEEIELSQRLNHLARRRGSRVVILHRHPLLTSSRKLKLYSPGEHLWFLARSVWGRGRTFKNAADCAIWYDGRR